MKVACALENGLESAVFFILKFCWLTLAVAEALNPNKPNQIYL